MYRGPGEEAPPVPGEVLEGDSLWGTSERSDNLMGSSGPGPWENGQPLMQPHSLPSSSLRSRGALTTDLCSRKSDALEVLREGWR